jgi:hypothetical protein
MVNFRTSRTAPKALVPIELPNLDAASLGWVHLTRLVRNAEPFRESNRFDVQGFSVQISATRMTSRGIALLSNRLYDVVIE